MSRSLAACCFVLAFTPAAARAQASNRAYDVKGAAIVGIERFSAVETFAGIFGNANGTVYGGGGDVRIGRHLFARVDITHFSRSGERAFAQNGKVFRLGIPLDVSITPVTATAGYRAAASRRVAWYVGAGAGSWSYNESGPDSGDSVKLRATGYLALGGVEWQLHRFVALGFEGQYASVPNAIGKGGLSADLKETDLGGMTGAVRIVVGR